MAKRSKKNRPKSATAATPAPLPAPAVPRWQPVVMALIIVAAGLWIYAPSLHGGWLWDDDLLVTDNPELRSWEGLGQIWFSTPANNYWPLTFTLLWGEWHLWGNEPFGYRVVSLALHLCSGLLIWRLLGRLGLRWGWLGGLLFVVHPLAVESVAWIAEIKNTLSLPLFLLSCDAWLDAEQKKPFSYLQSVLYYLAAMLAKTSTVMLPVVLLLHCWWKRGRITREELRRMIPYVVIAVVLGLITVHFQDNKPDQSPVALRGGMERSVGAATALFFYLGKFFLPLDLLPIYPRWTLNPPSLLQLLTLPALAGLLLALWTRRKSWGRHALFGFGFFLVNVLPVLGLVKMVYLNTAWVSDHLVYLPIIGLIGLVVAGAERLREIIPSSLRLYGAGAITVLLVGLVWQSQAYASLFVDQETLWTHELRFNPLAWPANYNLGRAFLQAGKVQPAIEQLERAIALAPSYAKAHFLLGSAYVQQGRAADALEQFQQAIDAQPDYADAHYNLGDLLKQAGRPDEAAAQYQEALRLDPTLFKADYNLGNLLLSAGNVAGAIDAYRAALKIAPDYAEAHDNLANALMRDRQADEAIGEYQLALKDGADDAGIHYDLGNALYVSGRADEAITQFQQALALNPSLAGAHYNLGYVLMQTGHVPEAIEQFQETLKLHPEDTGARENLEKLQALQSAK